MKNYFLLLLFVSNFIFSQQNYLFKYRMDAKLSTVQDYKTTEDFYLFSQENSPSFFISEKFYQQDSILQNIKDKGLDALDFSKAPKTKFKFVVEKNVSKKSIKFYDNILKYKFFYEENTNHKWNILNEKLKIGELNCTKATINLYGREWVAWFTPDIPLPDGPYKFSQLPGLIVRINDIQDHFKFELIEIKKLTQIQDFASKKKLSAYKQLTKKEYLETVDNINNNMLKEVSDIGITLDEETQKRLGGKGKNNRNRLELNP